MSENPYVFTPVDSPDLTAAELPEHVCPEFPSVIRTSGHLDETESLRLAKQCRPFPHRDPKTGKPVNRFSGWLLTVFAVGMMIYFGAEKLLSDISNAKDMFEVLLLWLTCALVPFASCAAAVVIFRWFSFRIETADPPVWGDSEIEFTPHWFVAKKLTRDGKLCRVMYRWPNTQVRVSDKAWLLNHLGANSLLIPRSWVTTDQQAVLDQFLEHLNKWNVSPVAQKAIEDLPDVFPVLSDDGISFTVSRPQHAEFERLLPEISKRFSRMPQASFWSRPWTWKGWGIGLIVCALSHPTYVMLNGEGRISIGLLFPLLIGWLFYKAGQSLKRNVPELAGFVTDSTVWIETKTMRTSIPLHHYSQCQLLENGLLLSAENTITPLVILRSSFATEADRVSAREKIEATVKSHVQPKVT